MLEVVRAVPGAADTSIEQEADQPQLRIAIDRGELARYGLNISDVQDVIELAIGGRAVGAVFEGERRFDMTVRYVPEARADPAAIGQILVATPSGGRVPLGQLARIETVRGPSIIARRENERQITVRTNIRERDQGGFVAEAQAKVAASVTLPAGYRVSWGGQFENLARARARLAVILPVTILIVFAPAVRRVRVGARCRARAGERAVLAGRRYSRALPARHPPVGVGGRGIRHAVRRRGHGRPAVRCRDQSPAERAGRVAARTRSCRARSRRCARCSC